MFAALVIAATVAAVPTNARPRVAEAEATSVSAVSVGVVDPVLPTHEDAEMTLPESEIFQTYEVAANCSPQSNAVNAVSAWYDHQWGYDTYLWCLTVRGRYAAKTGEDAVRLKEKYDQAVKIYMDSEDVR